MAEVFYALFCLARAIRQPTPAEIASASFHSFSRLFTIRQGHFLIK
jgi:hypothetical protein